MADDNVTPSYENLNALWGRIESVRCGLLAAINSLDEIEEADMDPHCMRSGYCDFPMLNWSTSAVR